MSQLNILYKDSALLILNKPATIPVQPDPTEAENLLQLAEQEFGPLFVVHRIDRPVSGITIFARNKAAAAHLSEQIQQRSMEKEYLAVTQSGAGMEKEERQADKSEDDHTSSNIQNQASIIQHHLTHYLLNDSAKNKVKTFAEERKDAQKAELTYQIVAQGDRYNLLKIKLLTGRHHQIRAQLAAAGMPIKGDVKYGARRGNPDRSIHLHAWNVVFEHPHTGEMMRFVAPPPASDPLWTYFTPAIDGLLSAV